MTTTTATMTYAPSTTQVSVADATASTIVLRRGHSATPLFLHRTPVYQVRSTASMSHLSTSRPSAAPALSRSSTPAAQHTRSESTTGRILVSSSPRHLAHNQTPTVPSVASTQLRPTTSPRTSFARQFHVLPAARPPPPNKALPPIPFPSGPPTPPEDTSAARDYFAPVTPSLVPAARPVSQDTEDTIRELEQLAASLKEMSASTASARVSGVRRDRDFPPVKISVSEPCTPSRRAERHGHAGGVASLSSRRSDSEASVDGPHIVVTNASMEALPPILGRLNSVPVLDEKHAVARKAGIEGVAWKGEDPDAEEVLWMDEYGAWGASEKGKWKAIGEEEDDTPSEQDALSLSEANFARHSIAEKSYVYEPIGAPEFLIGSSTSRNARAGSGFRSRRSLAPAAVPSTRRPRRPRPTPLVLANSAEAELALATALLLGTPRKRSSTRRPQTAPHTTPHTPRTPHASRARQPTPPSASLPRRQQAAAAADGSSSYPVEPSIAPATTASITATATEDGHEEADDSNRHSEPLPAMPRVPSSAIHVLRGRFEHAHAHARPMTAPSGPSGSHSEPNSPRPAVRPRLKSLKSLFKHWSK